MIELACIVEGHGDAFAVPVLLRRLAGALQVRIHVPATNVLRVPKSRLLKPGELERHVELAALRCGSSGRILVVVDADEDCPADLGPRLLERALSARSDRRVRVVVAKRAFEAWFVAGSRSLAAAGRLDPSHGHSDDPEAQPNPKSWIAARMTQGSYVETRHQPALADLVDLDEARTARSFDKFVRDVTWLLSP